MADGKENEDEELTCRIKCSVEIDLSLFEPYPSFSEEWVEIGAPVITKNNGNQCVVLYGIPCGIIDTKASKVLEIIDKSDVLSKKAFVGIDPSKQDSHCLVALNVFSPIVNRHATVKTIISCYGALWFDCVSIPSYILKDQGVLDIISNNLKNGNQLDKVHLNRQSEPSSSSTLLKNNLSVSNVEDVGEEPATKKTKLFTSSVVVYESNKSDSLSCPPGEEYVAKEVQNLDVAISSVTNVSECLSSHGKDKLSSCIDEEINLHYNLVNKTQSLLKSVHETLNSINDVQENGSIKTQNGTEDIISKENLNHLISADQRIQCSSILVSGTRESVSTSNIKREALTTVNVNTKFSNAVPNVPLTPNLEIPRTDRDSLTERYGDTNLSDLPESIKKRLAAFERASLENIPRGNRNNPESDGLPNLMEEGGTTGICHFLLGRTGSNSRLLEGETNCENDQREDEDDGENGDLNFPADFLERRKVRHVDPFLENRKEEDCCAKETDADESVLLVIKDELDEIFDLMSELPKDIEIDPCSAIKTSMLSHQKQALKWMISKENTIELPPFWECIQEGSDYFNLATRRRIFQQPNSQKGGILADDMGLGKTLVTIALILTNHVAGKPMGECKQSSNTNDIFSDIDIPKKKKSSKSKTVSEFNKPGFQFRQIYLDKLTKDKKVKKKDRGSISKDTVNLKDSDDRTQLSDKILAKKEPSCPRFGIPDESVSITLIVCPMSVISNWTDQFKQHVCPSIKVLVYLYYGPDRIRDIEYLKKHDVIITTYGTLTADHRASNTKGKSSPLHKINWLRVILDEGHIIRNAKSQQSVAATKLNAARRWILTGTVIQNRMSDLWSVIKFLHIEPFNDKRWWTMHVSKSMERTAGPGMVCFNRIQKIVKHLAIRRLKTDTIKGKPIVSLPKRDVEIKYVILSEEERNVYDVMQKDGKFIVCRYFQMNTIFKNYANVLVIIMRLRQLCCHPNLCTKAIEKLEKAKGIMNHLKDNLEELSRIDADLDGEINKPANDEEHQKLLEQIMMFLASGDSEECSICLENLTDPVITKCAHIFCAPCITEVIENTDGITPCPLCRADVDPDLLVKVPSLEEQLEKENSLKKEVQIDEVWQSSAKIDMVMEMLITLRKEDSNIKSLVVSQFTSFLDIVEIPLKKSGFQFVRLDGTMSQAARFQVMEEFKETDSCSPTIMLLSLTAGGVGLNLTTASRVFLLDPAWNPASEEQCYDRVHRLGQKKDVKIYKFIVKDSVEERMLQLQEKKRNLMKKAFGGGSKQTAQQRRLAALQDIGTLLDLNLVRSVPLPVL